MRKGEEIEEGEQDGKKRERARRERVRRKLGEIGGKDEETKVERGDEKEGGQKKKYNNKEGGDKER